MPRITLHKFSDIMYRNTFDGLMIVCTSTLIAGYLLINEWILALISGVSTGLQLMVLKSGRRLIQSRTTCPWSRTRIDTTSRCDADHEVCSTPVLASIRKAIHSFYCEDTPGRDQVFSHTIRRFRYAVAAFFALHGVACAVFFGTDAFRNGLSVASNTIAAGIGFAIFYRHEFRPHDVDRRLCAICSRNSHSGQQ